MGERRGACNVLVGRPDGKRPLGRPGSKWEHNIKIELQEVAWGDMDWNDMVRDRNKWREFMNAVMNIPLT
jgi:hypothetical protein